MGDGKNKKKMSANARHQEIMAYVFIAVPILLFLIFMLYPVVRAFYLSFTKFDILTPAKWVGFDNYKRLFGDELFFITLKNILFYVALYVPALIILSLAVAMALNKIKYATGFRVIYYIPTLTSGIGAATVWMWLLNPEYGIVNQLLGYAGVAGPAWLANSSTAMVSIVIVMVWAGIGNNMVIYLAGLQGIPNYLYESASLDGARRWGIFRYITWPALRPTTFFVTITSMVNAFQLFDQAFAMTQGGPGNATMTPIYLIYTSGFNELQMGYASTMAVALFIIIAVISFANMKLNGENSMI